MLCSYGGLSHYQCTCCIFREELRLTASCSWRTLLVDDWTRIAGKLFGQTKYVWYIYIVNCSNMYFFPFWSSSNLLLSQLRSACNIIMYAPPPPFGHICIFVSVARTGGNFSILASVAPPPPPNTHTHSRQDPINRMAISTLGGE